ncbi:hypothetical protein ScalyP_jg8167 [Parmales sp. scaly parma]|nr:hypothetical protein ScalyP_jg8167 [Parmales sp. scaly parma]
MQNGRQVARLPDTTTAINLVVNSTAKFAKNYKIISGSYLLGILVLLFGSGAQLTYDQQRTYENIIRTIDTDIEFEASSRYGNAYNAYYGSKGWFSCDSLCTRMKKKADEAKRELDGIRAEGFSRMSDAKASAGIFSEVGVNEARDSFWEYFNKGKKFAKRQSMWDALFVGMRSMGRNESTGEYMMKMLMNVLMNFTLGLVMCFFVFVFSLWALIKSYQPDTLTAVAFFICAACGAFATVATFLVGMFGTAGGAVFVVAKVAEQNMIQNGGNGDNMRRGEQRRHLHYQ